MSKTGGGGGTKWADLAAVLKAAEAGEPEAVMELGLMHEFGREVPEDAVKARTLYVQAAAAGVVEADFRLGRLLSEGLGGPADLRAAFDRYLKAARAGHALAQYNVGAMLASARGVRRNYVEGLAWIILATRDKEVDPTGERKLRERLARRPQDIAAAEVRALALEQEMAKARDRKDTVDVRIEAPARPELAVPKPVPAMPLKPMIQPLAPPPPMLPPPGPVKSEP
jgi:TPR repeat protein